MMVCVPFVSDDGYCFRLIIIFFPHFDLHLNVSSVNEVGLRRKKCTYKCTYICVRILYKYIKVAMVSYIK